MFELYVLLPQYQLRINSPHQSIIPCGNSLLYFTPYASLYSILPHMHHSTLLYPHMHNYQQGNAGERRPSLPFYCSYCVKIGSRLVYGPA